jgi:alkylation response protein AidB-like acyl-CoA dehydrogenase
MMDLNALRSPLAFLQSRLPEIPHHDILNSEETWWKNDGVAISDAIDRAGTPWLRMFDRLGKRVDEILYPLEYQTILKRGYRAGVVWRALEEKSLIPTYLLMYAISYYDPGICCPYTVSLGTTVPLAKYGSAELQARFLPQLLRKDDSVWQGATWMTEIKGGSDLGAAVETIARPAGDRWLLTGEKYFTSNAGAELAVVAARPEGVAPGVRGLALFLVPRYRENGELNYLIRRLKDKIATRSVPTGEVELKASEGYLLGSADSGIYLILEVLNLSRVANSVVSVAVAQRAMADALSYAVQRAAFGKPILDHPLLRHQFENRLNALQSAFALAWESVQLLNDVWMERAPLFRSLSSLPAGGPSREILDGRVCSRHCEVGDGSARRAGRTGRIRRRTLAARGDDSRNLGGNLAPPDSRWPGSDGTKASAQTTFPATRGHRADQRTSRDGVGSRAALETAHRR